MVVFIGNIPKTAAEKEFCQIARLDPRVGLRIIKRKARSGQVMRYALVPATDEKRERSLIKRMQGFRWLGHRLAAHSYEPRVTANERRRVDWRNVAWTRQERRLSERRTGLKAA